MNSFLNSAVTLKLSEMPFSVPTPLVSPFFRLEVAMATTKEDKKDSADNLRKALAPEYQIGLYGGIRF